MYKSHLIAKFESYLTAYFHSDQKLVKHLSTIQIKGCIKCECYVQCLPEQLYVCCRIRHFILFIPSELFYYHIFIVRNSFYVEHVIKIQRKLEHTQSIYFPSATPMKIVMKRVEYSIHIYLILMFFFHLKIFYFFVV